MKRRVSFASGDRYLPTSNGEGGPYGADIIPVAPRPQGNQQVLERLSRPVASTDRMPDGTRGGPFGTVISSSHYIPRVAPKDPCKPDGSRYLSVGRDMTGHGAKGAWVRQAMQRYRRHGNAANQPGSEVDALSVLRHPEHGTASDVAGGDLEGEGWWDDFSKGANSVLKPVLTAASYVPGPVGLAATAADLLRQGTMGNQTLYGGDFGGDLDGLEGEGWFDDLKKGFNTIASPVLTIASKAPGPIGMAATAANMLRKGTLGEDKYFGGDMTDNTGADAATEAVPGAPPGESVGPIPENVVNSNQSWEAWIEQQKQQQQAPPEEAGAPPVAPDVPTAAPPAAAAVNGGGGLQDLIPKGVRDVVNKSVNTVASPLLHGVIDATKERLPVVSELAQLLNLLRAGVHGNERFVGTNGPMFKGKYWGGGLAGGDAPSSPSDQEAARQLLEVLSKAEGEGLAGGALAGAGWFDDLKKGLNTIASPVLAVASKAPGPIGMAATAANLLRQGTLGNDKYWGNGLAGGTSEASAGEGLAGGAPAGGAIAGGAAAGGALAGGGRKRRRFNPESRTAKRAAAVQKVMKERKCSLVEASRIVKHENIEY